MVMMCRRSRRLISPTRAASVVVLPEPVGPQTMTIPRPSPARSSRSDVRPRGRHARHLQRQRADAGRGASSLTMQVHAESDVAVPVRRVDRVRVAERLEVPRREQRRDRVLDFFRAERRCAYRDELAVHSHRRRSPCDQEEVGAIACEQGREPGAQCARAGPKWCRVRTRPARQPHDRGSRNVHKCLSERLAESLLTDADRFGPRQPWFYPGVATVGASFPFGTSMGRDRRVDKPRSAT